MTDIFSKDSFKNFCFYFLIFILAAFLHFILLLYPPNIQIDEPATFITISGSNVLNKTVHKNNWADFQFENSKEYKISDFYKFLFIVHNDKSSIIKDLKYIRAQKIDPQHLSLYYGLLRLWFIGSNAQDSNSLLLRARSLNLIFFAFAFFFMYKLLSLISKKRLNILIGLIFAFFSAGSFAMFTMAREYCLQSALFIAFTYTFCYLLKKIYKKQILSIKDIIFSGIIIGLFLLSGYFTSLCVAIFILVAVVYALTNKNYKIFFQILASIILSLSIVLLLCPGYFDVNGVNSPQTEYVINQLLNIYAIPIRETWNVFYYYLKDCLFYPIFLIFCILIFIFKKIHFEKESGKETSLTISLVLLTFLWVGIIMSIVLYQNSRYLLPAIPILSLSYILLLDYSKRGIKIFMAILFIILTMNKVISNDYYDKGDRNPYFYELRNYKGPMVISDNYWTIGIYTFLYSANNNKLIYEENAPINNYKYKKYVLFTCKNIPKSDKVKIIEDLAFSRVYLIDKEKKKH